ncbi:response regulator transcription factor [Streptomyces cyaneofuscatus]|uniref:response regulator transcription factor n=1 Tax=Streptomyces arboris TaxID=2600619 RepID=UPI0036404519
MQNHCPLCGSGLHSGTIEILDKDAHTKKLGELTDQERAVFVHMATGPSNADLAKHLHLTASTIKFHLANIRSKLGGVSRLQLCLLAVHHEACLSS